MKIITKTKFVTKDGREFDSLEAAQNYEQILDECEKAISSIGKKPSLNHGCWVQHSRYDVFTARRNLYNIAKKVLNKNNDYPVFKNDADVVHPCSLVGRIIDDAGGPLNKYWNRLMCINFDNYREYDQPYFAMNPDEAE